MKIFLSIKYHADQSNRERIEGIARVLAQHGDSVVCIARDVEQWGRVHFGVAELMRRTFAEIKTSDLFVIDLTEKGVGVGIEAGYAHAKQIPIIVVAQKVADISATLRGIAYRIYFYDDFSSLVKLLDELKHSCQ